MKIITNGDGMAREVNPYAPFKEKYPQSASVYRRFATYDSKHPPLLLIDQNGNEVKVKGEFEAEKVWQTKNFLFYNDQNWHYLGPHVPAFYENPIRQAYQLTSPIVPLINEPDITQPIEKESGKRAETVEEAAV